MTSSYKHFLKLIATKNKNKNGPIINVVAVIGSYSSEIPN